MDRSKERIEIFSVKDKKEKLITVKPVSFLPLHVIIDRFHCIYMCKVLLLIIRFLRTLEKIELKFILEVNSCL